MLLQSQLLMLQHTTITVMNPDDTIYSWWWVAVDGQDNKTGLPDDWS